MLKWPLGITRPESAEVAVQPIKRRWGLVVSQCCDNEAGDYVSVAWVATRGGMSEDQASALANSDPRAADLGYTFGAFQLDPVPGVLEPKKPESPYVAELERSIPFWGPVSVDLRATRRARMTPEARRLLRIKLGLLWGRVEGEDAEHLERIGLPPGLEPKGT